MSYSAAIPGETVQPGELTAAGLDWIADTPAWQLPPPKYAFGFDDGATDFQGEVAARIAESQTTGRPPAFWIGDIAGKNILSLHCMLDQPLAERLGALPLDRDARPQRDLFWREVLDESSSAVKRNFSPDGLNAYNASLFSDPALVFNIPGKSHQEIATFFTEKAPINWLIGGLAASTVAPGSDLRIKELASGPRVGRWEPLYAAARELGGIERIEATVSDFVQPAVPNVALSSDQVRFTTERHSLLEPMTELPHSERHDVMLATYAFDSVWMPGDVRLTRFGDQWLQTVYRLKVADTYPRQQEMLDALRQGEALENATGSDYSGNVFVEASYVPFDIASHPYAAQLQRFIPDGLPVNVPVGYITTVVEAFEKQLTANGAFIVGECGIFGNDQREVADYDHSGAALYKQDHYGLAQAILREVHGLDAQTYSISKLADQFLQSNWRHDPETRDTIQSGSHNAFVVVRRQGAQIYHPAKLFDALQ